MKQCAKCNQSKPYTDFYEQRDRKSGYSYCKQCFNKYCMQRWTQAKIDAVIYKGSRCEDCSLSYPNEPYQIFDFHHLDPSVKDFDWNKMRLVSKTRRLAELDKCVLLCANCHRKRHVAILSS
jgi:hypothetical protein